MANPGGLVLTPDDLRVLNSVLDKIMTQPELSQSIYAGLTDTDTALIASMTETVRKQWSQLRTFKKCLARSHRGYA